MNYIFYAIISAVFFSIYELLYKFTNVVKIPVDYFICLWYLFASIFSLFYFFNHKVYEYKFEFNTLLLICIISVLTIIGNFCYFSSCKLAINPGISRATYSAFVVLFLTIISYLGFNKTLNIYELLGIIFILFGISLILVK